MIFGNSVGKLTLDGYLAEKFFDEYHKLKESSQNVGWLLINEVFPKSHIMEFSTNQIINL